MAVGSRRFPNRKEQMIEITEAPITEWTKIYSNVYSQFGEDGVLEEIFKRIGTTNKQCFEVGAADGKWFSNARKLIDEGWSAALIEADPANWPELDKLDNTSLPQVFTDASGAYRHHGRIEVVHGKAEPFGDNSIDSILKQCGMDERMDLGVIDVDGQDYYLFNGMMKHRPRVMVVEYDPHADKGFVPDLNGKGQAGLAAILSVAISKGYCNVATTKTNAVFILNSEREKFYKSLEKPPTAREMAEGISALPAITDDWGKPQNGNGKPKPTPTHTNPHLSAPPVLATGKEQEIKIAAILSRPRFGLNVFWDCASEALSPWHIPIQSFYGVFWNQCVERAFEDNIAAGMDWIMTLDYDTLFSSRHVQMLIDALAHNPNIDAIAALQCRRGSPLPLAVRADGKMPLTGQPVQVTTAHFGLTIFRCEAFQKMNKKPWLGEKPAPDGSWGEGRLDPDIAFWGNWRDSGNTLFVHTGCRVGHVEEMASEFSESGQVTHSYLSDWRKRNGHTIKTFE